MKEKNEKKSDQWIKPWLKHRNQQNQSSRGVLSIRPFEKQYKIHRKITELESIFNEVSGLETCSFIKK